MTAGSGAGLRVAGAVRVRVPLRRPLVTAHGSWPACDSWLVRVMDGAGRTGWGEATLGPFVAAADQAALDDQVRAAIGSPMGRALAAVDLGPAAGGAVRAALDGALLDLGAMLVDRPRAASIAVNALVGAESLHASVAAAREAVAAGFGTIKLKGGGEGSTRELVERLAAVRAAVGPDVRLRLDVNGAWDAETAAERLRAIAAVDLELVEQPVAPGPIAEVAATLAELRATTGVRLAADESVVSVAAARALLAADAVDALVVKPGRVGGPVVALAIADAARAAGVAIVISTLLESGVGLLTGMVTASMLPGGERPGGSAPAHGLGTGGGLATDLVGGRSVVVGGVWAVPADPGIGLDGMLDAAAVERFAVERCGAWA